jgi:hypothetical protein
MKLLVTIAALMLLSFQTQEQKTVTLTLTVDEVNLIYHALGKFPAEQVEGLRAKIAVEANRQLSDTTKRK